MTQTSTTKKNGKNTHKAIRLRERKTKFIDILRTTPSQTVCPNFYILSHANGCSFTPQCDYCYLKASLWHVSGQEAFTNVDRMAREVRAWIAADGLESYVLNTGNLSDSLAFEPVRPVMQRLIEVFREHAEAKGRPHLLLLVTKGGLSHCAGLLGVKPCRNVVISFSVNNPEVAAKFERGAASTDSRLAAARQLLQAGWRVRMRIDPMFLGYDYRELASQVRDLKPERVTLGTLRSEPNLPRYTPDGMFDELAVPPEPNSLARYPLDSRLALYRQAVDVLNGTCPIALCEETRDVWEALGLDADGKLCNCNV